MELYLLRHGIAAGQDSVRFPNDAIRPLDARGKKQVDEIAKAMRRLNLGIETIWCSPFVRTRQTAAAVAGKLGLDDRLEARDELAANADPVDLLAALEALEPKPASILLVGHEPYLSRLLSMIASGGPNLRAELKKGGLAKLEVTSRLGWHQCALLLWLLPPRLLVKITR